MFSVIIPVHNKLPHLDRSVYSVLNQTFTDFELLLIDDASTDGSEEKIKSYQDPRIRHFKRTVPGPGGYAARNLGIQEARYDWICFLDADDEWHPEFLKTYAEALTKSPHTQLFTALWEYVNEGETPVKEQTQVPVLRRFQLEDYLKDYRLAWTCVVMVHKELIKKAEGFPANPKCKAGGDVDTWIRWLYHSPDTRQIQQKLAFYYQNTINQVIKMPYDYFCAYHTIQGIIQNKNNPLSLRKTAEKFCNESLYYISLWQLKKGKGLNYSLIKKMSLNFKSTLRILKLFLIRYKLLS